MTAAKTPPRMMSNFSRDFSSRIPSRRNSGIAMKRRSGATWSPNDGDPKSTSRGTLRGTAARKLSGEVCADIILRRNLCYDTVRAYCGSNSCHRICRVPDICRGASAFGRTRAFSALHSPAGSDRHIRRRHAFRPDDTGSNGSEGRGLYFFMYRRNAFRGGRSRRESRRTHYGAPFGLAWKRDTFAREFHIYVLDLGRATACAAQHPRRESRQQSHPEFRLGRRAFDAWTPARRR